MEHSQSPQKISPEGSLLTEDVLPPINLDSLHHQLTISYAAYRQNRAPFTFLKKAAKVLSTLTNYSLGFLHQFWRQIIPEVLRGPMPNYSLPISSEGLEKQQVYFHQFVKKRKPFFLIVYKSDCIEEEIQQAYIHATNIVSEGTSIKYQEMENQTAYQHWSMRTDQPEKYCIFVLQFDVFHKMLWFGTLTKTLLTSSTEKSDLLEHFHREVRSSLKAYQKLQDQFLGSYVQKQDRFSLDPGDDK